MQTTSAIVYAVCNTTNELTYLASLSARTEGAHKSRFHCSSDSARRCCHAAISSPKSRRRKNQRTTANPNSPAQTSSIIYKSMAQLPSKIGV